MPELDGDPELPPPFSDWFAARGWSPRAHQLAMVQKAREGRHALLIAPTGGGKTLAGFLPSLIDIARAAAAQHAARASTPSTSRRSRPWRWTSSAI